MMRGVPLERVARMGRAAPAVSMTTQDSIAAPLTLRSSSPSIALDQCRRILRCSTDWTDLDRL